MPDPAPSDDKDRQLQEQYEKAMRQSRIVIDPKTQAEIRSAALPEMKALAKAALAVRMFEETLPKYNDVPPNSVDNTRLTEEQKKQHENLVKGNNDAHDKLRAVVAEKNKDKKWFDTSKLDGRDRVDVAAQRLLNESYYAAEIKAGKKEFVEKVAPEYVKEATLLAALLDDEGGKGTTIPGKPKAPAKEKRMDR